MFFDHNNSAVVPVRMRPHPIRLKIKMKMKRIKIPPMLSNLSGESNIGSHCSAHWCREDKLCKIFLNSRNSCTSRSAANINKQHLSLCQLFHLGADISILLDTKQSTQEEETNFELIVNIWKRTNSTQNLC